jgi:WhiB family transcriptional regulator, redox-sensing transcriptional regulator
MGTCDDKVIGMLNQVLEDVTAAWRASGPSWLSAAACRSTDPELFFPLSESGKALEQIAEAKVICAACPVRHQCLEFALRTRSQGIWGGLTELERHAAARPMREEHAPARAARWPALGQDERWNQP